MKSFMKIRPLARLLLTVVVGTLTLVIVAQATQTITTPNAATVAYNLAAGGVTGAISVPSNVPVLVMCVCTTVGFRGVGQVSLLSIPGAGGFLEWVGLESTAGAAITQGFSGVLGTHILFCDFSHQVDLEVNTATSMRVHNTSAAARAGRVTLIW
jgi:hypothetical protein